MTNGTLINLLESRIAVYERAIKLDQEQGLEQAATTLQALVNEDKQILSYIKE